MNEDRELLELAAFAAGIPVQWEPVHGCFWIELGHGLEAKPWVPLDDDGDAFRLGVDLKIYHMVYDGYFSIPSGLSFPDGYVMVANRSLVSEWVSLSGIGPLAAIRRGIVLVAAEIGKQMKEQDK